jgi:hypothetical protein
MKGFRNLITGVHYLDTSFRGARLNHGRTMTCNHFSIDKAVEGNSPGIGYQPVSQRYIKNEK